MIMQFVKNLPTYLLALVYLVFGANYFLHFIPMPPMEGNAGAFTGVLYSTGFLGFVKVLEVLLGLLLLLPATRKLALLLIAPITVNILLFELFIAHQPGIGILLVLLNGFAIYQHRKSYLPIVSAA
jgi:putative oxidoreductase